MKPTSLILAATLLSGATFGACERTNLTQRPDIPNGEISTLAQMQDARSEVIEDISERQNYVLQRFAAASE